MQQLQSSQGLSSSSKPIVLQPITHGPTRVPKEHGLAPQDVSRELFVVPQRKPILPPIGSNNNDKRSQGAQEQSTRPPTGSTRRKSKASFSSNEADAKNEERNTKPSTSSQDYIGPAPSTYYINDTDVTQQKDSTEGVYKSNPLCFPLGLFAGVLGLLTLVGGIVMTTIGYLSNGKTAMRINGIVFIILGLMLVLVAYLYFCVVVTRHARVLKRQLERKKQNKNESPKDGIKKSRDEINRMFRVKTYTRNDVWGTG